MLSEKSGRNNLLTDFSDFCSLLWLIRALEVLAGADHVEVREFIDECRSTCTTSSDIFIYGIGS